MVIVIFMVIVNITNFENIYFFPTILEFVMFLLLPMCIDMVMLIVNGFHTKFEFISFFPTILAPF